MICVAGRSSVLVQGSMQNPHTQIDHLSDVFVGGPYPTQITILLHTN